MTAPVHSVRWRLRAHGTAAIFTCSAPVGASCRMWCAEGCEERCVGGEDGREHAMEDHGSCLLVEGLQYAYGGDAAEGFEGSSVVPLRDGPVVISWSNDDDSYVWDYAVDAVGSVTS